MAHHEQTFSGHSGKKDGSVVNTQAVGLITNRSNSIPRPTRRYSEFTAIIQSILILLLAAPPIAFLVYAAMIVRHNGKNVNEDPVPALQDAAKYTPTVFPIVFAAIIGLLLKSFAAWKLERGISVLSLEYLLSSRTVFSTVTTPFSLRTVNYLTPVLILLWALSPLGGQAAFRVIDVTPATESFGWDFKYLDYMSLLINRGPLTAAGGDSMSTIVGAFSAGLLSPENVKEAGRDAFGNIKIPMIESCKKGGETTDENGWYNMSSSSKCSYSSIIGIPFYGPEKNSDFEFSMETSYMYTDCQVSHTKNYSFIDWQYYMGNHSMWNNGQTLVVAATTLPGFGTFRKGNISQELLFTSYTALAATNATCALTTTYVEADVTCHWEECAVKRIRPSRKEHNDTRLTVLDGLYQGMSIPPGPGFLQSFVNSTNSPWTQLMAADPYSTPIEYYFTHPEAPYSASYAPSTDTSLPMWRGADIYPVGSTIFSQRFSQLLNSFWIASVAPGAVTGGFDVHNATNPSYSIVNVTGLMTPDHLMLEYHGGWLVVLVISSAVMLVAAIVAAVLGATRRGPDILDRASVFLRDNPYAEGVHSRSTEDGTDQARRLGKVKVCMGEVQRHEEVGYIAVGTTDKVVPLNRLEGKRLYI